MTRVPDTLLRGARVIGILAFAALAGCALAPPQRGAPVSYDFGPPAAAARANPGIRAVILVPPVVAPAPFDGMGIAYRLLYADPVRVQVYGGSRWRAQANELFTQRVRSHFAAIAGGVVIPADGARADYILRIELEELSQHFDSPTASRAVVRARAALVDAASRKLLAQRTFGAERPAGATAATGAKGLGEAADALIGELGQWAEQAVAKPSP